MPQSLLSSMLSSLPCSCLSMQRWLSLHTAPSQAVSAHPFSLDLNLPSPLLTTGTMHLIKGPCALLGRSLMNRTGLCGHLVCYTLNWLSKDNTTGYLKHVMAAESQLFCP